MVKNIRKLQLKATHRIKETFRKQTGYKVKLLQIKPVRNSAVVDDKDADRGSVFPLSHTGFQLHYLLPLLTNQWLSVWLFKLTGQSLHSYRQQLHLWLCSHENMVQHVKGPNCQQSIRLLFLWRALKSFLGWQRKAVSRTGSSIWRQTELPHWCKQSITECKWSSLCQQTSTFSLSWINISGSQPACSPTKLCVASHSSLPVATPSISVVLRPWNMEGGGRTASYQRARWMVNTKSLTCDLLDGRPRGERRVGRGADCLERRFPGVWGRHPKKMDTSNRLYWEWHWSRWNCLNLCSCL